jgi:MFS family permease
VNARSKIRSGLVAATWEGAFAQAFITWTSGIFLVKYALRLGASDALLGLLAALPFLAQTLQVATAALLERGHEGRRALTANTLLAARLLWLVPAGAALGLLAGGGALWAFLAVVLASSLLATAGAHAWLSWMGDLVPTRVRGRYFGFRGAIGAVVAVASAWAGGAALDALERGAPGRGFAAVYGAAALAGLLAWVAIRRQYHPAPRRVPEREPFGRLWRATWASRDNRRVFAFFSAWNVALGVAVPFWAKYMERDLGMSTAAIGVQGTVGLLVGAAFAPAWGRAIDRVGLRPVLLANACAIAAIPFLWLFARPGTLLPVWIDCAAVGIFWTGFNLAALNVPLSCAPPRGRATFLGVFGALTGLAMGGACILGGAIASVLGPGPVRVFGLTLAVPQGMFLLSGLLRCAALPLALRMPDPKEKSLVFLVQQMGYAVRQRLNVGRQVLTAPWKRPPTRPGGR